MILTLLKWIAVGILAIILIFVAAAFIVLLIGAIEGVTDYIKYVLHPDTYISNKIGLIESSKKKEEDDE